MGLVTFFVVIIILIDKLSVIVYEHVKYEIIWSFVKTEIVKNLWLFQPCRRNEEAATLRHSDHNHVWSFVRTEALKATGIQIMVLQGVTPCSAYIGTGVSEKYVTSIFKVLVKIPRFEFT